MLKNRRKKRSREQWENWRATWRENKSIAEAKEKLEDKKVRGVLRLVFEIIVTLAFAALVGIAMFQSVTMQESSMEPTISVGDRYFMNRVIYRVSSPKRGDVIVFRTNASDDAALHIRRVIGLPGETVQIVDGQILINGETYKEGRDFPVISNPGMASSPVTLESGEYFVLGDNRNNSSDSRDPVVGNIHRSEIIGKAWMRIWPLDQIGLIRHQ